MDAPAEPPPVSPPAQKAVAPAQRSRFRRPALSRRTGCLGAWLVFLSPVAYSLLMALWPRRAEWVWEQIDKWPPLVKQWVGPGPAQSVSQWLGNIDSGPTMVYLIFAAVLVLLTAAVFVKEEPLAGSDRSL